MRLYLTCFVLLISLGCTSFAKSANNNEVAKDSLRTALRLAVSDTDKRNALLSLAELFRYSDPDSCFKYTNLALQYIDENAHPDAFAKAQLLNSGVYFYRGDYHSSIENAQQGRLSIAGMDEFKQLDSDLLRLIGNAYGAMGQYEVSLQTFFEVLAISEELGNDAGVMASLNNIGVIYLKLNNFEEALDIFERLDETHDPTDPLQVTIPVNLGFIYYELGELDKAKFHLNRALNYEGDIDQRAYGLSNFKLGEIYYEEENYPEAIKAFNASIEIYKDFKNEIEEVQSLNGLARVYSQLGDPARARQYAREALRIAENNQGLPERKTSLETLYLIEKEAGNTARALRYFEDFKSVSDSLQNSKINSEIGRMAAEYEFRQQQNELIMEQKARVLEANAQLNRQKYIIIFTFVILLLALAIIYVLYKNAQDRKNNNTVLSKKNEEIEIKAEELRNSNEVKDRLFSIIAHDLRGPLSSLQGLLTLVELKAATIEDFQRMIPEVGEQFHNTSTLLNNLLQWSQSQMKGYKVIPEVFNITNLIKRNNDLLHLRITEKNLKVSLPKDEHLVYADENMIDLVILNLFSNAIKFCEEGCEIIFDAEQANETVTIKVQDTGVGIPEDKIPELFSESFYSTEGTNEEKGTGLGLMLCKDFIERNEGQVWVKSEPGKGSTFYFSLPQPGMLYMQNRLKLDSKI